MRGQVEDLPEHSGDDWSGLKVELLKSTARDAL